MSHVVSLDTINQFLAEDKLSIERHSLVNDLEDTAYSIVSGKLSTKYDVDGWDTLEEPDTRPVLVVSIIGMLTAGYAYNRLFAEDNVQFGTYGDKLIENANDLLDKIVNDDIPLLTGVKASVDSGQPSYYESEPVFGMGTTF